jgi:hypothetical protein
MDLIQIRIYLEIPVRYADSRGGTNINYGSLYKYNLDWYIALRMNNDKSCKYSSGFRLTLCQI